MAFLVTDIVYAFNGAQRKGEKEHEKFIPSITLLLDSQLRLKFSFSPFLGAPLLFVF
jgi:hypothetical protein